MNSKPEDQERLFEADQNRVDFELAMKLKQIEAHGQTPEWMELTSLLEFACGFCKFDANRVAADEIIRRIKRNCVAKVFVADIEDILNGINQREAEKRALENEKRDRQDEEIENG